MTSYPKADIAREQYKAALATDKRIAHICRQANRELTPEMSPVLVRNLSEVAVDTLLDIYPESVATSVIASGRTWILFSSIEDVKDYADECWPNTGYAESRIAMALDSHNRDLTPKQEEWLENIVLKSLRKTRYALQICSHE